MRALQRRVAQVAGAAFQHCKHRRARASPASVQRAVSCCVIGSGAKAGSSPLHGKGLVHLGGAAADLAHALKHGGGLHRLRDGVGRQHAQFVDQPVEAGCGNGPGIALVFDEFVHDRERAAVLALHQFDAAEQRGRVLEMRDVGEEAADLQLRMDAGGDPPQDLDDVFAVGDHARVRLLAVDGLDRLGLRRAALAANTPVGRNSSRCAPSPTVSPAWIFASKAVMNSGSAVASSSVPSRGPRRTAASTLAGPWSISV